jgi:hypothetical protein
MRSRGSFGQANSGRRGAIGRLVTAAACAAAVVVPLAGPADAAPGDEVDLGPNVFVFDPSMSTSEIETTINGIWLEQRDAEMLPNRYSLLFMPGDYGTPSDPLQIAVGYYTEVAGLGASPDDVQINGKVEVFNRCFDAPDRPNYVDPDRECFALNNFWRSISNLTINVNGTGQGGCEASANFWAVSQASSMRRVQVNGGNLSLMDYCSPGPQFASGGFIADSRAGVLINGSQQQWITRNSEVGEWTNAVWNQVFTGVIGAPDDAGYAGCAPPPPVQPSDPAICIPYTTVDTTPISREKPYLFVDDEGGYNVRVPRAARDTSGISWGDGLTPGRTIPISDFFVADPADSVQTINNQLARGKHLLLTPGVYDIARSIEVKRPDSVVLGMGHATLHSVDGAIPLTTADKAGIIVAGVTIDAGEVESPALLQVGKKNGNNGVPNTDPANPVTLSDVYFRIGGPYIGKTDVALEVNSDHVLIDHTWVWRADHGIEGFDATCDLDDPEDYENCEDDSGNPIGFLGDDIRWATNIGRNGAVVNGDDVTATGLFVEHFQEYNTIWNGERGEVYLYQNELPYDPPTQADWTADDGTLGWAAYKVADHVQEHTLWGAGVYIYNRNNPTIVTENGYEVPETPGVRLNRIMTNNLSGPGVMNHIVNGCGPTIDGIPDQEPFPAGFGDPDSYEFPRYIATFPGCPY